MSYIINNSRGQIVAVIPEGVVNTSATNLALIGQAVQNYGTFQNENYLYLLENFANSTAPTSPVLGQLWYNSSLDTLHSYSTANTWVALASQAYVDAAISTNIAAALVDTALTGVPTAPTASTGTSTTQIATTAFVNSTVSNFSGNINNATLVSATLVNPTVTGGTLSNVSLLGNSTAVTAANGTATTQIATTEYVINQLSGSGPIVTTGNISAGNVIATDVVYASGVSVTGNASVSNTLTVDTVVANNVVTSGTSTTPFRLPNLSQTQINALSPQNGDLVYNTTTNLPQVYQNGVWNNFTLSYYA